MHLICNIDSSFTILAEKSVFCSLLFGVEPGPAAAGNRRGAADGDVRKERVWGKEEGE